MKLKHWTDILELPWKGNAKDDMSLGTIVDEFKETQNTSTANFIDILVNHLECGEDILDQYLIQRK